MAPKWEKNEDGEWERDWGKEREIVDDKGNESREEDWGSTTWRTDDDGDTWYKK